ncbi:rolling circle replication-associated protein [Methanosarcina siciliae]
MCFIFCKITNLKKLQGRKFYYAWNKAIRQHYVVCELTLTARPYGYKSLVECNQKTLEALEKFIDFMRYHLPDHVEYISVLEFQKNGRIHFHVTFFGINWLMNKSAIQYAWKGYGGGEILDIHTIRRRGSS